MKNKVILLDIKHDAKGDIRKKIDRPGSADVRMAYVWLEEDGSLRFELSVFDDIPNSPVFSRYYNLFLDTDLDKNTGLKESGMGIDFTVQLAYTIDTSFWSCLMFDMINTNRIILIKDFSIIERQLIICIPLSLVNNPRYFTWFVTVKDELGAAYIDRLPDKKYIQTKICRF